MGLCDSAEPRTLPWKSSQSEGILQSGTETEIEKERKAEDVRLRCPPFRF